MKKIFKIILATLIGLAIVASIGANTYSFFVVPIINKIYLQGTEEGKKQVSEEIMRQLREAGRLEIFLEEGKTIILTPQVQRVSADVTPMEENGE